MDTRTVLLIILAAIVALGLVLFQYYYKSKKRGKLGISLSFLRFLTWFGAFLILINPKFSKNEYTIEKTDLLLLSDNTSSMSVYRSSIENALSKLLTAEELSSKFELKSYNFGLGLNSSDSLSLSEKSTNINKALTTLNDVHSKENTTVILLTDGNQTLGNDYVFGSGSSELTIFPVAVGDTTRYEDIQVNQVNANKYAFLKNKFPVEVFVSYEGSSTVSETVSITLNGTKVFSENIKLSYTDNSKVINTLIDAGSVGVKYMQVVVSNIESEKNIRNNEKNLTVEVIDEKTNVAIVSDILHPDIGALKKAIESNEQRSVSIKMPNDKSLDEVDLFIFYQPTSSFKSIYEYIQAKNANSFSIIGPNADLSFVNGIQEQFRIEDNYPLQEVAPVKNDGFTKFDISKNSFEDYPPLDSDVGPIIIDGEHEALLKMRIKGVNMASPLLSVITGEKNKKVLLVGENIWKWRVQAYRNDQSFQNFDEFIGKLMVYLSDNKSKERLTLDFKSVYEGSYYAKVSASYFDETFAFDSNASLVLQIKNTETGAFSEIPMLLKNGFYETDLGDQKAGEYQFTVSVKDKNQSKSGSFRIMDFDVEQQFLSTDHKKLQQLADRSSGELFYGNQIDALIDRLTGDERFTPVQVSNEKVVSLIDFKVLLGIIAATLSLEWFIRKYNGLT